MLRVNADQGRAWAQHELATQIWPGGEKFVASLAEKLDLFERAAAQDFAPALCAVALRKHLTNNKHMAKSRDERNTALDLFCRSAAAGHAPAMIRLFDFILLHTFTFPDVSGEKSYQQPGAVAESNGSKIQPSAKRPNSISLSLSLSHTHTHEELIFFFAPSDFGAQVRCSTNRVLRPTRSPYFLCTCRVLPPTCVNFFQSYSRPSRSP